MKPILFHLLAALLVIAAEATIATRRKQYQNIDYHGKKLDEPSISVQDTNNNNVRIPRELNKKIGRRENVTEMKPATKPKVALVKKPIPKFTEADSEEDYQMKMRSPIKYSDSVEHEDEDFNLDDYDFDIHHDEFAGRGKPLQPRLKVKVNTKRDEHSFVKAQIPHSNAVLRPSKTVVSTGLGRPSNQVIKKAKESVKDEEYDDDLLTTTDKSKANRHSAGDTSSEDDSGESNESPEYESRSSVRTARSPLSFSNYMEKFGEKTNTVVSKMLSFLQIFPQHAVDRKQDK